MSIMWRLGLKKITIKDALRTVYAIKHFLREYADRPFIIGKTDNPKRRDNEHDQKGYLIFEIIFTHPSLDAIDEMEKCVIRYFKITETTEDDIANVKDGGAGKRSENNMYYIYVAIKTKNNETN